MTPPNASMTQTRPLPAPDALVSARTARLSERIRAGRYPVQPMLIAEAILACDETGPCGSARAIELTLFTRAASKD